MFVKSRKKSAPKAKSPCRGAYRVRPSHRREDGLRRDGFTIRASNYPRIDAGRFAPRPVAATRKPATSRPRTLFAHQINGRVVFMAVRGEHFASLDSQ
jgi:hypothetical protein